MIDSNLLLLSRLGSASTHLIAQEFPASLHLAGSKDTGSWQFRGKRITAAVVQHLLMLHGLKHADDILITGDSAGGVAAFSNADYVYQIIRYALSQPSVLLSPAYNSPRALFSLHEGTITADSPFYMCLQAACERGNEYESTGGCWLVPGHSQLLQ